MIHPDREALLAEMTGGDPTRETRQHLESCEDCRQLAAELRRQWDAYRAFHHGPLAEMLPQPPRPWEDLRPRMIARSNVWQWTAIAAAMVVAILAGWQYLRQPPSVSAAALLVKAVAAAKAPSPARRIIVRSTRRTLVRPAIEAVPRDSEQDFRKLFAEANYSWEEPLSAKSFQEWRGTLESATDHVEEIPAGAAGSEALYLISTSTTTGKIHHATLSLRQADLAPVLTHLEFPGETIEISPEPSPAPPPAATIVRGPAAGIPEPGPTLGPTVSDELRVVAALHGLAADLGEPVVVERTSEAIRVSMVGVSPERAAAIRTALTQFPQVHVEAADLRPATAPPGSSANPAADRILALSDALMARAFAIRNLEARFPGGDAMGPPDRDTLRGIFADHAQVLEQKLSDLTAAVQPRLPTLTADPTPRSSAASPESLLAAARDLDQALNRAFASRADSQIEGVAEALAQLRAAVVAHRTHWSAQR
jgi:hypothetical protein